MLAYSLYCRQASWSMIDKIIELLCERYNTGQKDIANIEIHLEMVETREIPMQRGLLLNETSLSSHLKVICDIERIGHTTALFPIPVKTVTYTAETTLC